MEITVMLFNYLTYNLAALSNEVEEAYLNSSTQKYYLKIKTEKLKILQVNNIPELMTVNIKHIYNIPKYLQRIETYKDGYINPKGIWGFVRIKGRLLPLIRLEFLASEVNCEAN